jgi:hypothetical protein
MKLKLRRRSVYIATIVAILAMAGGFALATFPNGITLGGASSGQNSGTFSAGNTIWEAAGASVALVQADSPATSCALSVTGTVASVYLNGAATCATGGTSEWYEEFQLAATEAVGDSDTFNWYVVGGVPAAADQSFTLGAQYGVSGPTAVTLVVYIDMGPASTTPVATVSSISVTIAGS